jgi:hypothetical protein
VFVLVLLAGAGLLVWFAFGTGLLPVSAQGEPHAAAGTVTASDAPYDGADDGLGAAPTRAVPTTPSARPTGSATDSPTRTASASAQTSAQNSAQTSATSRPAPRRVDVATTYSGWDAATSGVIAGGYVTGVIEAGGTCTLTLTRGGTVATGTSQAVPDARTTSCGEVRVDGGALSAGQWSGVLSYRSGAATGASAPFAVVVP